MRQRILGGIGFVWGGLILMSHLRRGGPVSGSEAYVAGQNAAVVVGILLLVVGRYYFLRKPSRSV